MAAWGNYFLALKPGFSKKSILCNKRGQLDGDRKFCDMSGRRNSIDVIFMMISKG